MARALQEQYLNIVQGIIEDESVVSRHDANLKAIAKILTWGDVRVFELMLDCADHKVIPLANW